MDRKLPVGVRVTESTSRKSIRISFTYKGVNCRETLKIDPTAQNIKYAERLRSQVLLDIERGTFDYAKTFPKSKRLHLFGQTPKSSLTVGKALEDYLTQKDKTDRASSAAGYRKAAAHFKSLSILPVQELTAKHIRDWVRAQTTSPKTIRNRLSVLRGAVNQAIADGLVDKDPFLLVKVNDLIGKQEKTYDIDPLSMDEIRTIVQTAIPPLAYNIQLACFTGLRTGELLGLRWQDVDLDSGWIRVSSSVVNGEFEQDLKTSTSHRKVKMLPLAKDALLKIQEVNRVKERQPEFVCLTQFGKRYSSDKSWNSSWCHVFEKLPGIRYRNPYQTRHTFASLLLMQGEPPTWVAEQLGHKNLQMVIMRYGRWVKSETNEYEPSAKLYYQSEF